MNDRNQRRCEANGSRIDLPTMTLDLADLEELTATALAASARRVNVERAALAEVERELARLETLAEQIYALTAMAARREADVETTSALWRGAVQHCDAVAARIHELGRSQPVAQEAYDRVLDIRSAARELVALHSR